MSAAPLDAVPTQATRDHKSATELQTRAAQALAAKVLKGKWDHPHVLEIGCGTGGLTHLLMPRLPGYWLITDIAPSMLDTVQSLFPASHAQFRMMDGEAPDLPENSLDLIVSNLAAQWFDDLGAALQKLAKCLKPDGRMVLTTLGHGSLTEWQSAVAATGYQAGTPTYPTAQSLTDILPQIKITPQTIPMSYGSAAEFLKSLKAIGATTPAKGYTPRPTPIMRDAMTRLGAPCQISYEVLTLDWVKPCPTQEWVKP